MLQIAAANVAQTLLSVLVFGRHNPSRSYVPGPLPSRPPALVLPKRSALPRPSSSRLGGHSRTPHTLIAAPTGSAKPLRRFLPLDELYVEGLTNPLPDEVRVVYVSPLKGASAPTSTKNLAEPRRGIKRIAEEMGWRRRGITAAVRTGDTTASERRGHAAQASAHLVTTPESLYLLLTAERSREMLRTARTVIVDEIHAVIGHAPRCALGITLDGLQQVAEQPLLRPRTLRNAEADR